MEESKSEPEPDFHMSVIVRLEKYFLHKCEKQGRME